MKAKIRLVGCALLFHLALELLIGNSPAYAAAWELCRDYWSDADELAYSSFVQSLGESNSRSFSEFLADENENPLYDPADRRLKVSPDCGELPYFCRAYTASKRKVPFVFMSRIRNDGGDSRYSGRNRPGMPLSQSDFDSLQKLFDAMKNVNSGYYRMAPDTEDTDTYPVEISSGSIKPGSIFYDAQGHVMLVSNVESDGRIRMVGGHPDNSLSRTWFGEKYKQGTKENGGGFRRWRPLPVKREIGMPGVRNAHIHDYSGLEQYQKSFSLDDKDELSYHEYVTEKLKSDLSAIDPIEKFQKDVKAVFDEIKARETAVNRAVEDGISELAHPGRLPANIFSTSGIWGRYSTPSRDIRLKQSFRELYENTGRLVKAVDENPDDFSYDGSTSDLIDDLSEAYELLANTPAASYRNADDRKISLSFQDISDRLSDLSFDPYHSPELRWGEKTAPDDNVKLEMYKKSRRLRNLVDKIPGRSAGFDFGPMEPVDFDIGDLLRNLKENYGRNPSIVKSRHKISSFRSGGRRNDEKTSDFELPAVSMIGILAGLLGILSWIDEDRKMSGKKPSRPDFSEAEEVFKRMKSNEDSEFIKFPESVSDENEINLARAVQEEYWAAKHSAILNSLNNRRAGRM